jgi:hypothetical protein
MVCFQTEEKPALPDAKQVYSAASLLLQYEDVSWHLVVVRVRNSLMSLTDHVQHQIMSKPTFIFHIRIVTAENMIT